MKKTLLATAIAGAMAASGAQAATVYNQDGTKLDIYGNIQIAYINTNDSAGDSEDEIADNGSTFGFAAEHVIYDGLTGYLKLEFDDFQADEMKVAGRDSGDQAYVGLKGNFGDVRLGSYDPLIDDWIQDPITNNEYFDASDSNSGIANVGTNDREGDKVTYTSPVFSGFQFAVGTQYKGDAEENEFEGTLGQGVEHTVEADSNASFFGGVKYTAGAFSIAAAYDNLDNYDGKITSVNGSTTAPIVGTDYELGDQYGVTAQYTIDALRLAAKYEKFDAEADDSDIDFVALGARYGYGMGDVYGAYQNVDYDDSNVDDRDEVIVGATYNISDAMYTWAEAAWYDKENDEDDGFGVGITYLF
ncbi:MULTISPECIES: porin [Halomonas]|uniref:Porin n=1 Tax=Halomonas halophila TaxID=29573 RepID=A0ABQ0U479_9GAMM|nr:MULTISPECIES: porin [Halomonas]MDR5888907.1 porin [Halomonas salina]WJY08082.1 porin [Halomonas halophila]GEK73342.1 porin [Halomonas halophila]